MLAQFRKRVRKPFAIATLLLAAIHSMTPARAQGVTVVTVVTGKITSTYLSYNTNFAFRVNISNNGANPLSTCQVGFAYVNVPDDNYQAKVSSLLSAYAQGKTVTIVYSVDAGGFCHLIEMGF